MNSTIAANNNGTYNLYVNGRLMVRDESYTVVSNIEDALLDRSSGYGTECGEVADSIRGSMKNGMGEYRL